MIRIMQKKVFKYSILFAVIPFFFSCLNKKEDSERLNADWPVYLGDNSSNQYSALQEINKINVKYLKLAWEYHTGDDVSDNRSQIQCNPIIIDGILYGTSPKLKVFALEASTGKKLWEFDPDPKSKSAKNVNRGVSFWSNDSEKRILFTSGSDLFAVNAKNGEAIHSFGDSGRVSLKEGLDERSKDLYVVATSPGIVYKNLLIIGSRVSEDARSAPGYIRAFDIITGKLVWVFHTIPKPGEFGYETWPKDAYKTIGGVNSWAGMSLDSKRGIVFIPTGSAAFDFWGGNRKGENLFANCILALDAKNGKRIWHFQTVHHDLWDRDLPAPPNLVSVIHNGKKIDAVAQITKTGFIFLLERETGQPLFPVEEMPVPSSDLIGEEAWPTQPVPLKPPPFVPQIFSQNEITNISKESSDYVANIYSSLKSGKIFVPPSTEGTIIFPGFDGGGEWGGAAHDPENSVLYVNASIMPWILSMVPLHNSKSESNNLGGRIYKINCAICHGLELEGDPTGTYPELRSVPEKYSKEEIIDLVNTGRGFMPSFKHLNDNEKNALAEFLRGTKSQTDTHSTEIEGNETLVPYTHKGYNRFLDQNGYPAIKPPWGTISAIDLNKGDILWQVPLGEYEELTKMGVPKTGTENYGGPAITAGGILFIGASKDGYFRAIDKDNGNELWKYKLPAGGYATPAVYKADGKQYVVIACGGGKMGTASGDSYVAFTLPSNIESKN